MDCRSLAFRQLPHQPKIVTDFLEHFERVKEFYAHSPTIAEVTRVARELGTTTSTSLNAYPAERRAEVARILREQNVALGASGATLTNLERFSKGAIAIVSGQQVGLFGGPAYSIYKALTAVQIAKELTEGGIDAVPVFWMATEDHDLDEVRHTTWFDAGRLMRFEMPVAEPGKPVGRIRLGEAVEPLVSKAGDLLENQGGAAVAQILRESYTPQETYASAFGKLFARLFAEHGLILLDPLDPGLHKVAAPMYQHSLAERDDVNAELLRRGKALESAGYAAQVKVTARSTLLFYMGDGVREPISASNGGFQAGEKSWPREELVQLTHSEPQNFSPNALFRAVVQDYLLPTAAYVAGPAEISYFAQSEVAYRRLLGRMPVMLTRVGFTLVDAKAQKVLGKFGLQVEDVWAGPQALRRKIERASVPAQLSKQFEKDQKQIEKLLAQLGERIGKLDPTLVGSVETAREKIGFHLEKLRLKTGRSLDEKSKLIASYQEYIESLLYPHKILQSRELCFLPFLARWGDEGLHELQKHATGKNLGHHFIIPVP